MVFNLCTMTDQMMRASQLCTLHTVTMLVTFFFDLVHRQQKEHFIFHELLQSVPGLENQLMSSSEEEVMVIADFICCFHNDLHVEHQLICHQQIQKGASGARDDDTKGMKGPIIDWITPKGQSLTPHIPRNVKSGRGFHHDHTGALLCPAGLDWNSLA